MAELLHKTCLGMSMTYLFSSDPIRKTRGCITTQRCEADVTSEAKNNFEIK